MGWAQCKVLKRLRRQSVRPLRQTQLAVRRQAGWWLVTAGRSGHVPGRQTAQFRLFNRIGDEATSGERCVLLGGWGHIVMTRRPAARKQSREGSGFAGQEAGRLADLTVAKLTARIIAECQNFVALRKRNRICQAGVTCAAAAGPLVASGNAPPILEARAHRMPARGGRKRSRLTSFSGIAPLFAASTAVIDSTRQSSCDSPGGPDGRPRHGRNHGKPAWIQNDRTADRVTRAVRARPHPKPARDGGLFIWAGGSLQSSASLPADLRGSRPSGASRGIAWRLPGKPPG
ncbi:hypothetical protein C7415_103433 [Cupriavidus alkaliphilus]|nr:hypothetical protein C7415_103433 [Cupriavidus alkaliphilus]